jgi:hypothetical protein
MALSTGVPSVPDPTDRSTGIAPRPGRSQPAGGSGLRPGPTGCPGAAPHAPIPAKRRPAPGGRLRARNLVGVPGQVKPLRRTSGDRLNVAQARHFRPDFYLLVRIARRPTIGRCRFHARQRHGCPTFAWNHSAGRLATTGAVLSYDRRMHSNCMQNRHEPGKTKNKRLIKHENPGCPTLVPAAETYRRGSTAASGNVPPPTTRYSP